MIDFCGCCESDVQLTPLRVENRPGLSAVAYRIGTYGSFLEAMLAKIAGTPSLERLATRSSDDYAITTLELWAAVADVLTFYQERYANEAFLRTAVQRESVARLARLIDYHLRPGAAAVARLVFNIDDGKTVEIPVGLKVQSVPGQDEQPQTFETIEAVTADARFNRLRIYPAPSSAPSLSQNRAEAILDRTIGPELAASVAVRDRIVLFNDGETDPIEMKEVDSIRIEDDRIIARWTQPVQRSTWNAATKAFKLGRNFRLFGYNAPSQYMTAASSGTSPQRITWTLHNLSDYSYPISSEEQSAESGTSRLCLDGRYEDLEPGQHLLLDDTAGKRSLVTVSAIDQVQDTLGGQSDTVTRLTVKPALSSGGGGGGSLGFFPGAGAGGALGFLPGGFLEFESSSILGFSGSSLSFFDPSIFDFSITTFEPAYFSDRRKVVVHELIDPQIIFWDFVYGPSIGIAPVYLPGWKVSDEEGEGIEVGRTIERNAFKPGVVVRPKDFEIGRDVLLTDADGGVVAASITATPAITAAAAGEFCHLVLSLSAEGALNLSSRSSVMLGNVAHATHGETVSGEVLGSGEASKKFQRLTLKKKPLTYVPSTGPGGVESTLQVQVNGVRWKEEEGLYGQAPTARVYATRIADDGSTVVQFGDGTTGSVLPTGAGNVTATYRTGIGLAGRVDANTLTTLLQRPTGLKDATNPLAAEGGADPETSDLARENAPQTVRTFGRAVSLRDFEDLVRASGEVAKAQAIRIWDGLARAIHLTVAGQEGGVFTDDGLCRLAASLTAARDPNHRLRLDNFNRVPIIVQANITVKPEFDRDTVSKAALSALLGSLSFDALRLGQPVHVSDIFRVLQETEGVQSVDVEKLMFKKPAGMSAGDFDDYLSKRGVTRLADGSPSPVQGHLRIFQALVDQSQPGRVMAAELAWVESATQDVTIGVIGANENNVC